MFLIPGPLSQGSDSCSHTRPLMSPVFPVSASGPPAPSSAESCPGFQLVCGCSFQDVPGACSLSPSLLGCLQSICTQEPERLPFKIANQIMPVSSLNTPQQTGPWPCRLQPPQLPCCWPSVLCSFLGSFPFPALLEPLNCRSSA